MGTPTIDLSDPHGIWRPVYAHRTALHGTADHIVLTAWRRDVHGLDLAPAVAAWRMTVGETITPAQQHRRQAAAAAVLAALAARSWPRTRAALATGAKRAHRAGWAAGHALATRDHADDTPYDEPDEDDRYSIGSPNLTDQQADDTATAILTAALAATARRAGRAIADSTDDPAGDGQSAIEDGYDLALIVDAGISAAYGAGLLAAYIAASRTAVQWITAGDGRVCSTCLANEEGSPYSLLGAPTLPAHPRCLVGSTRVSAPGPVVVPADVAHAVTPLQPPLGEVLGGDGRLSSTSAVTEAVGNFGWRNVRAATDRYYVGDVITIRTARGYELTGTPNHPVATSRGWVPLAELEMGDHVLSSTRPEWVSDSVDPDVDDIPPAIEQVAQSFAVTLGPMPTASEDFHGDGSGSDVHVVRTDGLLMEGLNTVADEHVRQRKLCHGDVGRVGAAFLGLSNGDPLVEGLLPPSGGGMGCIRELAAFLGRQLAHAYIHGSTASPDCRTGLLKVASDDVAANGEFFREYLFALSSLVPRGESLSIELNPAPCPSGLAGRPEGSAALDQSLANGLHADSEGFCERLFRFASDVAADEVVHVDRYGFTGHVYNLETVSGWYIGNGILTHNCRCVLAPS